MPPSRPDNFEEPSFSNAKYVKREVSRILRSEANECRKEGLKFPHESTEFDTVATGFAWGAGIVAVGCLVGVQQADILGYDEWQPTLLAFSSLAGFTSLSCLGLRWLNRAADSYVARRTNSDASPDC